MVVRYVDDMVIVTRALGKGWHWDKEKKKLVWTQYLMDQERTSQVRANIANSINSNIQTTIGTPEKNGNCRIPLLDLEVWMRKLGVCSNTLLHEESGL